MKPFHFLIVPLLLVQLAGFAQSQTQVPTRMNYQGYVTNAGNVAIGAGGPVNREVVFRFWSIVAAGGDPERLWSEQQTVTINEGNFSVLIGGGAAIIPGESTVNSHGALADVFTGTNVFLGITVDDGDGDPSDDPEISPRQRIVTTAFAFRSKVAEEVVNNAIDTNQLKSSAVATANLANDSVNNDKIDTGAVNSDSIADGSILAGDLKDNAVTTGKILADAVTSAKIDDGTIQGSDIASNTVSGTNVLDGSLTGSDISDSSLTGTDIQNESLTSTDIQNGSLTGSDIQNGSVLSSDLASNIGVWTKGTYLWYIGGNVGIGTSTPTKGKLEISGSVTTNQTGAHSVGDVGNFYGGRNGAFSPAASLYASNAITGSHIYLFSDERIKRIEGRSDAAADLATLCDIEVTDYRYIDSVTRGTRAQKKVIAQQVEKVFPQAVSKSTDEIPDIYKQASFVDGWVQLDTDLKEGERVRLIGEKEEGIHEVLEVREGAFRTGFKTSTEKVFVFGRQVDDFRNVDYDAIAMLNVSATQQIKKELDAEVKALTEAYAALHSRFEAQEKRLAALDAQGERLAELEARDMAREANFAKLEKLLKASPRHRPVSLELGRAR